MVTRFVYLVAVALLVIIEVAIAVGALSGPFMRGSIGDVLVTMVLYFLLRGILSTRPLISALLACALGFCVEGLQYLHIADLLGVRQGEVLYIVIGNTFSISDLLMYVLGGALAFYTDRWFFIPAFASSRLHNNIERS